MIDISVIIATHNRAAFLSACIASLCEQTIDPARYEICVISNACTDNTAEIVTTVAQRYPQHRIFRVDEPVAGVSRARNRGIASTTAPLIANMDDDATANPNWLECYLSRFAALPDDVAVIGGEVDPVWEAPPPPWLEPWMKGLLSAASNMGDQARFIEIYEGLFEGNCCYRRCALTSIGNYPLALGRVGNTLLSGENAMNTLMRFKGWRLFFDPAALIHHTIHADRLTPAWMRKRIFWQGISDYAVHRYHERNGLKTVNALTLDLPLHKDDWGFIATDSPLSMHEGQRRFQNLGFVLAMSGIIPIDES